MDDSGDGGNAESNAEEVSDCYANHGRILTELTAIQSIDLQNKIPDAELAEEFAREYQQMTDKLHKKWKHKELIERMMPFSFPDPIQPRSKLILSDECFVIDPPGHD